MKNNDNNIDFSIIIPIYNCEKYLDRCIISVLEQSYDNFELILLNDGSIDESLKICKEYAKKDKRIIVIDKKNSGVSDTRNEGIKHSKGKYICFLDSDDFIDKDYLKVSKSLLNKYPNVQLLNFGFFSEVATKNDGIKTSDAINTDFMHLKNKEEIRSHLIQLWDTHMLYNIWNKIYLKDIIINNKILFPNTYFGEDMEFNKHYLDYTNALINSDKCFYHYIREREGSVTKKYKDDIFKIRKNEFYSFNEYFEKNGLIKKEYYEFSCRRFIERVLGCIENVFCSKYSLKEKYKIIKNIVNDETTRETVKYAKPKSKKMKIALLPLKYRLVVVTMINGKIFHIVKHNFPSVFNSLKNKR